MRIRKHHNNRGERQIKEGKTALQVKQIARRLGVFNEISKSPKELLCEMGGGI